MGPRFRSTLPSWGLAWVRVGKEHITLSIQTYPNSTAYPDLLRLVGPTHELRANGRHDSAFNGSMQPNFEAFHKHKIWFCLNFMDSMGIYIYRDQTPSCLTNQPKGGTIEVLFFQVLPLARLAFQVNNSTTEASAFCAMQHGVAKQAKLQLLLRLSFLVYLLVQSTVHMLMNMFEASNQAFVIGLVWGLVDLVSFWSKILSWT